MRTFRILHKMLGIERVRVVDVEVSADQRGPVLVITVEAFLRDRSRCPHCGKRCPGYDRANSVRRWRHLDAGSMRCFVQAPVSRVYCEEHGVVTERVVWARSGANMTRAFDDNAAWLVAHSPASSVCEYLRVSWRTVTRIVERVVADHAGSVDRLDGLRRIGIDEIAYRKGHRYLTVIVDHDTGRLVWAGEGATQETLRSFFDELGVERTELITHVSADGANWIAAVLAERLPRATRCMDPFHVIKWANEALDRCRSRVLDRVPGLSSTDRRHLRWALWKNPENLTPAQQQVRQVIVNASNSELASAYQLKEELRHIISGGYSQPGRALTRWTQKAEDSAIREMRSLAQSIRGRHVQIINAIVHGMSNGRVEATNTHLRALTKRAYGFHSPGALVAMATLTRGGACPVLPQH